MVVVLLGVENVIRVSLTVVIVNDELYLIFAILINHVKFGHLAHEYEVIIIFYVQVILPVDQTLLLYQQDIIVAFDIHLPRLTLILANLQVNPLVVLA